MGDKVKAAAIGGVAQGISMIGQNAREKKAHERNLEYMDIQNQNQRGLNTQQYGHQRGLNQMGHDLQYDMWNKTNYAAQVEHMKKAGLNPALMYGQAGQGGSTGSQGGGSAQGGSASGAQAPAIQPMDMQNLLIGAQIEKIKAETNKLNKDARGSGLSADAQEIVNNYLDKAEKAKMEQELEKAEKAKEEKNQAVLDTAIKNIVINNRKQGILDDGASVEWFTRMFGVDVTEDEYLNKKVEFLPDGAQNKLKEWGVKWSPGMTRRQIMIGLEMAIATGKATVSGVRWVVETTIKGVDAGVPF